MKIQSLFRVVEVVRGQGLVVQLHARDPYGRRIRIEVAEEEAAGVAVGGVLVVHWWAAPLPALRGEEPTAGASETPKVVGEAASVSSGEPALDLADREFRALFGLE